MKICSTCGNGEAQDYRACDVCAEVDGDKTNKRVYYCQFCQAWICKRCRRDYGDRTIAAIKTTLKKIINFAENKTQI